MTSLTGKGRMLARAILLPGATVALALLGAGQANAGAAAENAWVSTGSTNESVHSSSSTLDGAAWNGAAWNGAAWNGAAWNGAAWNGAASEGAAWNGAAWNGAAWNG
ncbi:MAG: hypothetical protein H0V10_01280, partial [Geodermatophilaceae bacterium]|nr:hypothetical protein [Geodermatophilaceae bacterium]